MAEEIDQGVIKRTQEMLGSVIKRPPLTEKSLKKPPFRFLHDIITSVIKTTGFMKGLYPPEEMLSENVKDKESKIAFLQKSIDVLEIITSQSLTVRPSKVVAGHEPQKTNEFLQALALAAKNKLDSSEAVQKVLNSGKPPKPSVSNKDRRGSVDKKPGGSQKKEEKPHSKSTYKTSDAYKKGASQSSQSKDPTKNRDSDKTRSRSKDPKMKERDKSKDRTRHSKPDDSRSREKLAVKAVKEKPLKPSEQVELEEKRNEIQGEDVNNKENGEMEINQGPSVLPDTENVSLTNLVNGETEPKEQNIEANAEVVAIQTVEKQNEENEKPVKERPQRPLSRSISRPPSAKSIRTQPEEDNELKTEGTSSLLPAALNSESGSQPFIEATNRGPIPSARLRSARPSSARPAPPKIRIRHIVENEEEIRPLSAKPVENVILDNKSHSDEEDETFVVAEEASTDKLEAEMPISSIPAETPEEDKGSLVKKLLETKKDLEGGSQQNPSRKVEIDKSQMTDAARRRERESAGRELEQLRLFIQTVSRTANPLGRMLDYLQEDIDAMQTELNMWREEHKQNLVALRREQSITESALEPLRVQLEDLEQAVQDQLDTNSSLKSTICRNDERIQRMLAAVNPKS